MPNKLSSINIIPHRVIVAGDTFSRLETSKIALKSSFT